MNTFVRERVATVDDAERIQGLGLERSCVALQSFALKTTSLGYIIGEEFNKLRL